MLRELHIHNIAVIHKVGLRLEPGLNVFTGETGAGKTILISAIDAVLGERASKEIIRAGEERATVTALFEDISPEASRRLAELGYEDDGGDLLISREITAAGKSACKIGGVPATAAILKEVASLLIHIHGQRDSLQLLAQEQHMRLIDAFGETQEDLSAYRQRYDRMCGIRDELSALEMDDAQKAQRMDMLAFQVGEIEAAELDDLSEEEALTAQRRLIRNSEKVRDNLSTCYNALRGDGDSEGVLFLMDTLSGAAGGAAQYIGTFEPMAQRLEGISYELAEFAQDVRSQLDDFEFDPDRLNDIEYRLDTISKLKRKYGGSIKEILEYHQKAKQELDAMENSEQRIAELQAGLEAERKAAAERAIKLSAKRKKAADAFARQVESELKFLDMPSVKLSAQRSECPLCPTGIDEVEFYVVTNVGETPKPLSKIASGGEVSRIMLAVKNVLAEKDNIATLIFDEVDTGVSGRAAQKIGSKLRQVARTRQVICVTHLAQVAAFGDNHLEIRKEVEDGRTFTRISALDSEARVKELARIISGDHITETALQNAREMLEIVNKPV